jgi:Protein of unknown function (DUF4019)
MRQVAFASRFSSRLAVTAMLAATLVAPARAQDPESVADAQEAAERWLAQLDAGNYAGTWRDASASLRNAVPQAQFEAGLRQARTPLGGASDRALKSATYHTTMPGMPDGQYVVIQYTTRFANKEQAVETVTPMREQDGSWRVSGYFVQ